MPVAGIDYGRVRVGVAVSDDLGMLAHPRPHLKGDNIRELLEQLCALAKQDEITRFVVGLPRHLNGLEGAAARRVRRFARLLEEASGVPVQLVDEWLSTREARSRLSELGVNDKASRERIDSAAAAVILQSWLDGRRAADG